MQTYMDTQSLFIPIDLYLSSPQRYVNVKCRHHQHHQLIEACSVSHQIFCERCDSKTRCGDTEGKLVTQ